MNATIAEVFNTYNVNILFTVAALPARVALGLPMGAPGLLQGPPTQGGNPLQYAQPGQQQQQQVAYQPQQQPQVQYQ